MFKKIALLVGLILFVVVLFFNRVAIKELVLSWQRADLPEAREFQDVIARSVSDEAIPSETDEIATPPAAARDDSFKFPSEYNLAVPFQPQAPQANWDLPYQEACEEASLIMADAFYNKKSLTIDEMDERIKKLVDWQVGRFGYYEDTTAAETATIAREYFGLTAELDYDVSVDNIKKQISQNKLVLAPAAGKILPNPNFRNGGPLYHMLVIRGYTPEEFITNDPGTRKGREFVYKYNDLLNAVHDWPAAPGDKPSEAEMLAGEKVMIVISK